MVKLDMEELGGLQLIKAPKGSSKLYALRKLPTFAKDKSKASPLQQAQWAHMKLLAAATRWMKDKFQYSNPVTGKTIEINGPAAFIGIMRSINKHSAEKYGANWNAVKTSLLNAAAAVLVQCGKNEDGGDKYNLSSAKSLVAKLAAKEPPTLTEAEKLAIKKKDMAGKPGIDALLANFDAAIAAVEGVLVEPGVKTTSYSDFGDFF
jgi:hypothetical protein